jgi:hypothetical protein
LNKTGPDESHLIEIAIATIGIEHKASSVADNTTSCVRLNIIHRLFVSFDCGKAAVAVCQSVDRIGLSASVTAWFMEISLDDTYSRKLRDCVSLSIVRN